MQASPAPTWGTLIRERPFNHRLTPAGTGYHSGSHSPCAVSLTLHHSSHVGRNLLSRPARHVRSSRLGTVSDALIAPISGSRIQKRFPTHPGPACPDPAPSLLRLTGKGLTPLSSLSFSRSAFLGRTPEVVCLRRVGVATARLPTPAHVNRTCRALHPIGLAALVRIPVGGFETLLARLAPALNQPAPPIFTTEHFPLARIRGRQIAMR